MNDQAKRLIAPIADRHSIRVFDQSTIADADLELLFEAARWAPSSYNDQPWAFVYAKRENAAAFKAVFETLIDANRDWAHTASVLVVACARVHRDRDGAANPMRHYDLGQAVAMLSVQATAMGFKLRQMGGFDRAAAGKALAIPETHEPTVAIALGRAGDPAALGEEVSKKEAAPRSRKDQSAFVHDGKWR